MEKLKLPKKSIMFLSNLAEEMKKTTPMKEISKMPYDIEVYNCTKSCYGTCSGTCKDNCGSTCKGGCRGSCTCMLLPPG